jgi:hypothetical protein
MKDSAALVADACARRRPARPPQFDIYQNDAVVAHFAGRPLDGSDDGETMIRAAAAGLDGTRHVAAPHPAGATWTDEAGNLHEGARWTSWVRRHAFTEPEQWIPWIAAQAARLEARSAPTDSERAAERARQSALNDRLGGTMFIHCTPGTSLNTIMFGYRCGLDALPILWADHPDLTRRLLRAVEADSLQQIALTAHRATSPLAMIYSDVAYHDRLMFSPAQMRAMGFFDDVAGICDGCHRAGLQVIFHSDGNVMEIMDDLVAAGIDGLNPLEKAAGMDVYAIRRRWPGLILVGGMDVSRLMPFGTPTEIRAETRKMIREVGAEGGLLIGSSTEIGNDIPLANYLAFRDEAMRG